jgi:hypothetical protein
MYNQRIQQFSAAWGYKRTYGTTGVPYLTDNKHYNQPSGVAIASDHSIYISESAGNRIVKLKYDGTPIWKVGENGVAGYDNDHFCYPQGINIAPDGKVFIADGCNDRVQVYDSNGTYVRTIGEEGTALGQFDNPYGVAFDNNGNLYVAEIDNHRFQVFDTNDNPIAKLGSYGSGIYEFQYPRDIAVDSRGYIYVVDNGNHRVQIYNSSRVYQRSIGTGVEGSAYDQLAYPVSIAVDSSDNVYIGDSWGSTIKVYDKDGKFLDCIENGNGSFQGMFRQVEGLAVDDGGNLFLADEISHQVKQYMPSPYPGWRQVNVTGFGSHYNWGVWSMTTFNDALYAATATWTGYGAELYKYSNSNWDQVMSGGFDDADNRAINIFEEFNGKLYAGTWNQTDTGSNGGQVWRSATAADGSWTKVVDGGFGSTNNGEINSLKSFDGYLYAGTVSYDTDIHGAEIYRSASGDSGSWTKVFDDSIPDHQETIFVTVMEVFSDTLYAGMYNWDTGAELWKTSNGTTWTQANTNGFGDTENRSIISLAVLGGKLYAGTQNYDSVTPNSNGCQIWRSEDGSNWEKVVDGGFGDPNNWGAGGLIVYRDQIFAIVNNYNYANSNETKGMEVWRSKTGDSGSWERVGWHSFGTEHRIAYHSWSGNFVVWDDTLFIGTNGSSIAGGRVWVFLPERIFLPIIMR